MTKILTNKSNIRLIIIALFLVFGLDGNAQKENLRVGYFQTEAEAKDQLAEYKTTYSNKEEWEVRKQLIIHGINKGAKLPHLLDVYKDKPFNTILRGIQHMDGYTVENIAIEGPDGKYITGNLYKPEIITGKVSAILSPHGHWYKPGNYGRFRPNLQKRCAALARMGAIVFAYDMIGYGESYQYNHNDPYALQIQLFNSSRVLDYLLSLDDVDPDQIGMTGASGGATQTFLLTAIDDRIAVSVQVVQVSAHFFGGCVCESGMPIHKDDNHETNNVEIAATTAPRPLLLISDGSDWTSNTPEVEYPYIKGVYELYNQGDLVENVHFAAEKHDYGLSKRKAAYSFFARYLKLDYSAIQDREGNVDESFIKLLPINELLVFPERLSFHSLR